MKCKSFIVAAMLLVSGTASAQKSSNVALTPPMGWNSWNKFAGNIDEVLIRRTADRMVELGLRDAGYVYLNLDDCWHGERDTLGFIHPDTNTFPSGMKALGDYIHSLGLRFGIYSDAGRKTCAGRHGSFGHEYQDALTYAQWGVDYLKYDWCNTQNINPIGAYSLMSTALAATGRPIVFSICEWGSNKPWTWAGDIGHLWRTTGDIAPSFVNGVSHGTWRALSVLEIIDMQVDLREYAGPGRWNDPDMLEVGNGLTNSENRAHFSMWCMLAAPLILGCDLDDITPTTLSIITNRSAIAIDQDKLGIQGLRYKKDGDLEFWFKPLVDGQWAMCILNRDTDDKSYTIDWTQFDFTDTFSDFSTAFKTKLYNIYNVWSDKQEGNTQKSRNVTVKSHDVVLYILSEKKR